MEQRKPKIGDACNSQNRKINKACYIKPLFVADDDYTKQLKALLLSIPVFNDVGAEIMTYNELSIKKSGDHQLIVFIEPETVIAPRLQEAIYDALDNAKLSICFFIL